MKNAFALLDLETVQKECEQSDSQVKECIWKMHYRNIEYLFISEPNRTPQLYAWMKLKNISLQNCLFREDCVRWYNRLLKRYPQDWKLNLVKNQIKGMELDVERYGHTRIDKAIFLDGNEKNRQAVLALNDPRILVCASLNEVAESMGIPSEAFTESDKAIARYRAEIGLDQTE